MGDFGTSPYLDENLFLNMLDAAAERIFEAHAEIMAVESDASDVTWSNPIAKQLISLQQDELPSLMNKENDISAPSKLSSSSSGPRKRRKRCRTDEQPSLSQTVTPGWMDLGLREETPPPNKGLDLVGSSQNYSVQSYGVNKPYQGLNSKEFWSNSYDQMPRKRVSRVQRNLSNIGSVACSVNSLAPGATLEPLAGSNIGNKLEDDENFGGFSKEIDEAITRIESLIPALQKLVTSVHHPSESSGGDSGSPNLFSLGPNTNVVNPRRRLKNVEIKRDKLGQTGKFSADGVPGEQMIGKINNPVPLPVNKAWNVHCIGDNVLNQTVFSKKDAKPRREEINLPNEIMHQTIFDKPLHWVSTQYDARGMGKSTRNNPIASFHRKLELERNLQGKRSHQTRENSKVVMDRVESLRRTLCRNKSGASQIPEHVQGFEAMPHQYKDNNWDQIICEEGIPKDAASRPQTPVHSAGSSILMRPIRASNRSKSHYKWSQSHARGKAGSGKGLPSKKIQFSDKLNRYTLIRKNTNGALRHKILLDPQELEDTSWSSPSSSFETTQQSDSYPSSSEVYQSTSFSSNESDESELHHGKLGHSSRWKQLGASDSTYDTSSYYSSQDRYSEAGPSSQSSPAQSHKWKGHVDREKGGGRLRRLKKKLGMIFHHHHHHHHHHYDSKGDESDVGHPRSFWKRVGKMFQHTKKSDNEKPKVEKSRKAVIKRAPTKKQQGHFRALVEGLTRHMKHSKKSKQAKDEFRRLGNSRHRGKAATKKLPCWPKGRGGLKMSNKGRVKLGRTRTKKPQLAAAKMILRQ